MINNKLIQEVKTNRGIITKVESHDKGEYKENHEKK